MSKIASQASRYNFWGTLESTNLRYGIREKGFAPVLLLKHRNSHCFVVILKEKKNDFTVIHTGCSSWERAPNESGRVSQFPVIPTVKEDAIDSETRGKIATAYASRPNPRSDLIYLRFYVYNDNEDSKKVRDQM